MSLILYIRLLFKLILLGIIFYFTKDSYTVSQSVLDMILNTYCCIHIIYLFLNLIPIFFRYFRYLDEILHSLVKRIPLFLIFYLPLYSYETLIGYFSNITDLFYSYGYPNFGIFLYTYFRPAFIFLILFLYINLYIFLKFFLKYFGLILLLIVTLIFNLTIIYIAISFNHHDILYFTVLIWDIFVLILVLRKRIL